MKLGGQHTIDKGAGHHHKGMSKHHDDVPRLNNYEQPTERIPPPPHSSHSANNNILLLFTQAHFKSASVWSEVSTHPPRHVPLQPGRPTAVGTLV